MFALSCQLINTGWLPHVGARTASKIVGAGTMNSWTAAIIMGEMLSHTGE
jgi:hypothetical protein